MAGLVVVDDQRVDKAGTMVDGNSVVRVKTRGRFVGRGGDKLYCAVEDLALKGVFQGAVVADLGSSTGGFTDCALQLGAKSVLAVDVGTNQLAWKLRQDPRVSVLENTDLRDPTLELPGDIDLVLADISFSPLVPMLSDILRFGTCRPSRFLILVKPQFELEPALVPPGGVVQEPQLIASATQRVQARLMELGACEFSECPSRVLGREGNQEVFLSFVLKSSNT